MLANIIMYDRTMGSSGEISRQLRSRRRELGLSLAEVARRADTSAPTVSRYERGWDRFEVATLRKLATALGCELVIQLAPRADPIPRCSEAEVVERLRRLFWDQLLVVDHLRDHALWVAERVLELGALEDVRMLIGLWGRDRFLELVAEARFTSERTRVFWQLMLAKEGRSCTRRYSRREAASSWRGSQV